MVCQMKIDYSLPAASQYMLHLDANARWGVRHIGVGLSNAPIDLLERVYHVFLGALMALPVLGHALALIDVALNGRRVPLKLRETDPYRRGLEFGRALKAETQFVYKCVKIKIEERTLYRQNEFNREMENLRNNIPPHIQAEMRGLSEGAEIPLEDVYRVHTFLDIFAGEYGCSAVAAVHDHGHVHRVTKTNHFGETQWCSRRRALQSASLTRGARGYQAALGACSVNDTVLSVVFDVNQRQVHFASSYTNAATTLFSQFSFFKRRREATANTQVLAGFNLDWPWNALAPYIRPVSFKSSDGRKKFVNITFPGYLGVLRGMNENGVVVGCCQAGSVRQGIGMPVTMLFRDLLENCASSAEAENQLANLSPASSMNLVVAARDGAFAAELDPSRAQIGPAAFQRAS